MSDSGQQIGDKFKDDPARLRALMCPTCKKRTTRRTSTGNGFCGGCGGIFASNAPVTLSQDELDALCASPLVPAQPAQVLPDDIAAIQQRAMNAALDWALQSDEPCDLISDLLRVCEAFSVAHPSQAVPLVEARPQEWQPIENAPMDTEILVSHGRNVMLAVHRSAGNGFPRRWQGPSADDFTYGGPSHWMPKPPAAVPAGAEPEVSGTSACPICGIARPHWHHPSDLPLVKELRAELDKAERYIDWLRTPKGLQGPPPPLSKAAVPAGAERQQKDDDAQT